MNMPSNEEYESLKTQQKNAQDQYNQAQYRIEDNNYKISRLKKTKATLIEQKAAFKRVKDDDRKLVQKRRTGFKGREFSSFQSKGSSLICENDAFLNASLDSALDAVNNEITRLENLNYNEYGLLGQLTSVINSLANKIENFFN